MAITKRGLERRIRNGLRVVAERVDGSSLLAKIRELTESGLRDSSNNYDLGRYTSARDCERLFGSQSRDYRRWKPGQAWLEAWVPSHEPHTCKSCSFIGFETHFSSPQGLLKGIYDVNLKRS
jgi:hypothetical protein